MPLALDVLSDILANPTFDPEELEREQNVIVQEIGAAEDTPDDLVFEHLQRDCVSRPADRPLDPRHAARRVRSFNRDKLRAYLSRNYRAPDMVVAAAGAVDHAHVVEEVEQRFASFERPAAPMPRAGACSAAARASSTRDLEQAHLALALEGLPQRDPSICSACRSSPTCSAAACRRGCSRKCAKSAACATRSTAFHMPYSDTGFFGLYAGTDAADAPELMQVVIDQIDGAAETDRPKPRSRAPRRR